jgi:hypothetical protein
MTRDEFFAELAECSDRFYIRGRLVRTRDSDYCPICELARRHGRPFVNDQWASAANYLGLDYTFARDVVVAADRERSYTTPLRRRLLETLGLKEPDDKG